MRKIIKKIKAWIIKKRSEGRFVKVTEHFGYRRAIEYYDEDVNELFGNVRYYIYEIVDGKPIKAALDVRYSRSAARWMCGYYEGKKFEKECRLIANGDD